MNYQYQTLFLVSVFYILYFSTLRPSPVSALTVGQWVIVADFAKIAIASTKLASLFVFVSFCLFVFLCLKCHSVTQHRAARAAKTVTLTRCAHFCLSHVLTKVGELSLVWHPLYSGKSSRQSRTSSQWAPSNDLPSPPLIATISSQQIQIQIQRANIKYKRVIFPQFSKNMIYLIQLKITGWLLRGIGFL